MARALEVDDLSGMVARSSQLLHLCAEQLDVSGLADLIEAADQVCFVVYEHVPPQDVGLREFLAMEDLERLLLLTRGCSQESIVSVLKGPALATITHSNQKHERELPPISRANVLTLSLQRKNTRHTSSNDCSRKRLTHRWSGFRPSCRLACSTATNL